MENFRLIMSACDTVDAFPQEITCVLEAVGHPEALVTDESQVSDFMIHIGTPSEEQVQALESALGRKVEIRRPSPENDPEIQENNAAVLQGLEDLMGRPVREEEKLADLARELNAKKTRPSLH